MSAFYKEGFIKRAEEYGIPSIQAEYLYKEANEYGADTLFRDITQDPIAARYHEQLALQQANQSPSPISEGHPIADRRVARYGAGVGALGGYYAGQSLGKYTSKKEDIQKRNAMILSVLLATGGAVSGGVGGYQLSNSIK